MSPPHVHTDLYRSGFELYRSGVESPALRVAVNVKVEIVSESSESSPF